jgi:hypothetical protein
MELFPEEGKTHLFIIIKKIIIIIIIIVDG